MEFLNLFFLKHCLTESGKTHGKISTGFGVEHGWQQYVGLTENIDGITSWNDVCSLSQDDLNTLYQMHHPHSSLKNIENIGIDLHNNAYRAVMESRPHHPRPRPRPRPDHSRPRPPLPRPLKSETETQYFSTQKTSFFH